MARCNCSSSVSSLFSSLFFLRSEKIFSVAFVLITGAWGSAQSVCLRETLAFYLSDLVSFFSPFTSRYLIPVPPFSFESMSTCSLTLQVRVLLTLLAGKSMRVASECEKMRVLSSCALPSLSSSSKVIDFALKGHISINRITPGERSLRTMMKSSMNSFSTKPLEDFSQMRPSSPFSTAYLSFSSTVYSKITPLIYYTRVIDRAIILYSPIRTRQIRSFPDRAQNLSSAPFPTRPSGRWQFSVANRSFFCCGSVEGRSYHQKCNGMVQQLSVEMSNASKVKDISLAEWGRKEIELAEVEMPGLIAIRREFGPSQPLKGSRISGSLHMTIQTAVLIETLQNLGASVRWCSCNIFSTQDHAAAAIAEAGTGVVFAWKGETLEEYWNLTVDCLTWENGEGPDQIVDDGGDATILCIEGLATEKAYNATNNTELPEPSREVGEDEYELRRVINRCLLKDPQYFSKLTKNLTGISEETTTGVARLYKLEKEGKLQCPCFNVNDSVTKSKFDNIYGCKHSLVDGINRATDVMISGKKVLICGFGDVGKGCAQAMRGSGARVYVTECDPICALQACMEGFEVVRVDDVLQQIDIYVTATGNKRIITLDHMKKMKHNAIVGNIGHFDNEIETEALKKDPTIKRINIKPQVDKFNFEDGHSIILLAEGRLLNLGCATGHPSFVMSTSFCNQTLAQLELWKNRTEQTYATGVFKLPKVLDEKVARLHLDAFNAKLTVLEADQADYIGVESEGPFKKDDYKY